MVDEGVSRPGDAGRRLDDAVRGRRPRTTRQHIAREALALFDEHGFESTTVDDIATAVGIGRRTFFRYYESKLDVVWGEFETELQRFRHALVRAPSDEPMMEVLRRAIVSTNQFGERQLGEFRIRIVLISTVPALIAHSAVRYGEWCQVVAEFVARRTGADPGDLGPQTVARASLGAATAAFACWARAESGSLAREVEAAFRLMAAGFAGGESS